MAMYKYMYFQNVFTWQTSPRNVDVLWSHDAMYIIASISPGITCTLYTILSVYMYNHLGISVHSGCFLIL